MERKRSRSVFLKKHVFSGNMCFRMCVPDACLGFRFGILPPAGQKSQNKHVLWIPFCYIASGGSKISKKTRPGNKNTHI